MFKLWELFRQAGAWPERWVPKQELGNQQSARREVIIIYLKLTLPNFLLITDY
jgi:hypothetical protein